MDEDVTNVHHVGVAGQAGGAQLDAEPDLADDVDALTLQEEKIDRANIYSRFRLP